MWCPNTKDKIPVMQCLNEPPKTELLRLFEIHVERGIEAKDKFCKNNKVGLRNLIAVMKKPNKLPKKSWLITLLSKVPGPSCEIFQPLYRPPVRPKPPQFATKALIDNRDGWYDNYALNVRILIFFIFDSQLDFWCCFMKGCSK